MNLKEIDRRGVKITDKTRVIVSQYAQSTFMFQKMKNQKDIDEANEFNKYIFTDGFPNGEYTYEPFKDDEYILCLDGKPFGFEIPEVISKKTPFYMESEHDIPEMNIKKGEKVLCFGGEGYAAGVFRYEKYNLEVV